MADAGAIKAILEQLADALPVLPEKMKEVVDEGQGLDKRADDLVKHIQELRAEAEGLFEQIRAALEETRKDNADDDTALDAAVKDLEETADEALKAVEEWTSNGLKVAVSTAGEALSSLQEMIKQGGEEAKEAKDEFESTIDDLRTKIAEEQEALQNSLKETLLQGAEELQGKLGETKAELESMVSSFTETLESTQENLSSKVEAMMGGVTALKDALDSDLKTIVSDVVESQTAQLLEELRTKIQVEVTAILDAAVKDVGETLGGLGEKVLGAKGESEGARAALEPIFDTIEELIGPLASAIDSIKDAAGTVGIDFD